MFQDSYIINDFMVGDIDFRYWNGFNSIEPYHWSDGLNAILISNTGSQEFNFIGSKRTIVCKVGDVTRIESTEYIGEGLLSPDAVNGKCALNNKDEETEG